MNVDIVSTGGSSYRVELEDGTVVSEHSHQHTAEKRALNEATRLGETVYVRRGLELRCTVSEAGEPAPEPDPETEEPGPVEPVTDLAYDPDAGVLRWTSVDDGTGHPATYALRHGPAPLQWGAADQTETVVGAAPIGEDVEVPVPTPDPGQVIEYALVPFRGVLDFDAVFGPVTDAVAVEGPEEPDEPTPDPEPGDSHEPDGFSLIAQHNGDTLEPEGWSYWRNENCGDQGYAEAVDGAIVGHFTAGMGDPCGQRPFTLDHDLHGGPELYVRHGLRLSPNWRGHGASQSKIIFLRSDDTPGNGSPAISMLFGSGDGDIELGFFRQNSAFSAASQLAFPANVGDATLVRGEWHVVEFLMRWDRLLAWVDGVLTHDYSGELFHTGPFGWNSWSWDPVYGGRVEVLDRDMEMSMDGIYISGR